MGKELIFSMSFGMRLLYGTPQGFTSGDELPSQKNIHSLLQVDSLMQQMLSTDCVQDPSEALEDVRMHRLQSLPPNKQS